MRHVAKAAFFVLALCLLALPATAQNVLDGREAANNGDYAGAVAIWRPLAEAGDLAAQTYMGIMHENGLGVPQDWRQAFAWYERAARRGYARAQYHLGFMYQHGRGVQRSQDEALDWYRLAAAQGNVHAQYNLGKMYAHGLAVERDFVEAHMWFELAASERTSIRPLAQRDRATIAKSMTPDEIEEAQERAGSWRRS